MPRLEGLADNMLLYTSMTCMTCQEVCVVVEHQGAEAWLLLLLLLAQLGSLLASNAAAMVETQQRLTAHFSLTGSD